MPRYLVERDFGRVTDEAMQEFAARARVLEGTEFGDVLWEGSHVCDDDDGGVKSFCIYTAPSAERLYEHADSIGVQTSHHVFEIVGEINPRDIAL